MIFKKYLMAVAIAGAFGLSGCSEGDNSTLTIEGDTVNSTAGNTNTGTTGSPSTCPDFASSRPIDSDGNNVCQVPTTISQSRTLTSDTVWFFADVTTVGNGNGEMSATQGVLANGAAVQNVTLSIEAGAQLRFATGTFANLTITRGSRIEALGTANAPIVMSSDDDDLTGSGEWGGLIVQGYGDHNTCSALPCNVDGEGESGFFGGVGTPDDDSGIIQYLVITEGGFEFAPGNEINGLSLLGVGSGTTIDHIQVNANADDGIEFYGGAVDVQYMVLTGNLDDSIDWDEGFQGDLQYVIVTQDPNSDQGVEADTFGATDSFLSKPTLVNVTIVGNGSDGIVELKSGSAGFFHNSVITPVNATIQNCVSIDGADAQANRNSATYFNNVISGCASFGDDVLVQDTVFSVSAALDANYASQASEAVLATPLDLAAFNAAFPESVADPGFFDADGLGFIGAVNPDGSDLWYDGWIIEGSLP